MQTATLDRFLPMSGTVLSHFGPATVHEVADRDLEIVTPAGARYWARSAVAATYNPVPGDLVLAVAADDECYVVGVLEGRGPTVLQAPGDLELRAPHGSIRMLAAEACTILGTAVQVDADELHLSGHTLQQQFETVRSRIAGLLDTRVRSVCTTVTETYRLAAQRIVGRGNETVTLEAPSINLG
ncbi:DUF3540 domain-containing protein [Acidisphaera sp. L21]|uniref:DUF3540 domain-containing protein n=1 Tax=Acidisphaera sp. L21 TaxID=1641851 RepID=UPI00131DE39A|nr:DUF3540 domain-containing protein [Acidisphaera sp. L21]